MITLITDHKRTGRTPPRDPGSPSQLRHYQMCEHLANERTHLAYVRASVLLICLGVTMNRVALGVQELGRRRSALLATLEEVGVGVLLYGLVTIAIAHFRYHAIMRAIDRLAFRPPHRAADLFSASVLVAALLGVLWLLSS